MGLRFDAEARDGFLVDAGRSTPSSVLRGVY
jgi:hypothetical protein